MNKAVVAARRIAEIDPYLPVRIVPEGLHADNVEEFVAGLDVLVEECDDIAMKALVREVARRHGVPVVMDTSDRGMLDVERFDQEPDRPIFHGILAGMTAGEMGDLSVMEKIPYVLQLVDPSRGSARGAASLAEIGQTLSTWPQLASNVTLGGASVATTVRRLGTGEPVPWGGSGSTSKRCSSRWSPPHPRRRPNGPSPSPSVCPTTPSTPSSTPPPGPPPGATPSRGGSPCRATPSPSSWTGRGPRGWTSAAAAATWRWAPRSSTPGWPPPPSTGWDRSPSSPTVPGPTSSPT